MCLLDNILVDAVTKLEDLWTKCNGNLGDRSVGRRKKETRIIASILYLVFEFL